MKKIGTYIFLAIGIFLLVPLNTYALNRSISYIQILDCGSNAILGSVNDPNSVAWLLQKLFNYTKVIGPFLVLLLSSIDYVKALISSDDDSMKKTHKKLYTRLILAASLFVLPTLVSLLLNVTGLTSSDICILN